MTKPKVGIFSLTCCEGCQIEILNLEDVILDVVDKIDLISFRLAMDKKVGERFDISFLEGSVSTVMDLERTKEIRAKSKVLVALGTCACTGGVQAAKNFGDKKTIEKAQFGGKPQDMEAVVPSAIGKHVDVDFDIKGCPIDNQEFVAVLKQFLLGVKPYQREWPVCVECKEKENPCLLDDGKICLGPVTYSGCGAVCPDNALYCVGCRGIMHDSNLEAYAENLKERGHDIKSIKKAFQTIYGENLRHKEVR